MFVFKMWKSILTHCQSVLLLLAHFVYTFPTEKLPFPQKLQPLGSCYSLHLNNTIFLSNSATPARTQTACTPASQKQFSVLAELLEWAHDRPGNTAGPASELCAQVLWKQRQKYYVKKNPTRTENS